MLSSVVVGMSGVYNLTDYYEYEVERAIEHVSFMVKANGLDTLVKHSPSYYANLMALSDVCVTCPQSS